MADIVERAGVRRLASAQALRSLLREWRADPRRQAASALGRITSLVVDPGHRQCGIGRLLVAAVEEFGRAHGCIRFEVTSGDHRPEAHAFYEHLGYKLDCRRFVKRTCDV